MTGVGVFFTGSVNCRKIRGPRDPCPLVPMACHPLATERLWPFASTAEFLVVDYFNNQLTV